MHWHTLTCPELYRATQSLSSHLHRAICRGLHRYLNQASVQGGSEHSDFKGWKNNFILTYGRRPVTAAVEDLELPLDGRARCLPVISTAAPVMGTARSPSQRQGRAMPRSITSLTWHIRSQTSWRHLLRRIHICWHCQAFRLSVVLLRVHFSIVVFNPAYSQNTGGPKSGLRAHWKQEENYGGNNPRRTGAVVGVTLVLGPQTSPAIGRKEGRYIPRCMTNCSIATQTDGACRWFTQYCCFRKAEPGLVSARQCGLSRQREHPNKCWNLPRRLRRARNLYTSFYLMQRFRSWREEGISPRLFKSVVL
jgi:hypothetical protein